MVSNIQFLLTQILSKFMPLLYFVPLFYAVCFFKNRDDNKEFCYRNVLCWFHALRDSSIISLSLYLIQIVRNVVCFPFIFSIPFLQRPPGRVPIAISGYPSGTAIELSFLLILLIDFAFYRPIEDKHFKRTYVWYLSLRFYRQFLSFVINIINGYFNHTILQFVLTFPFCLIIYLLFFSKFFTNSIDQPCTPINAFIGITYFPLFESVFHSIEFEVARYIVLGPRNIRPLCSLFWQFKNVKLCNLSFRSLFRIRG